MRARKILEGTIEKRFVKEVKKLGCITRKLNGMGNRDWPDRLILVPGGVTLFIEFKRPDEGLRPTQEALHEDVAAMGHTWYVFDNWEGALAVVKDHLPQRKIVKKRRVDVTND